jgi:tetratricopeptide (TPR) repeat protein
MAFMGGTRILPYGNGSPYTINDNFPPPNQLLPPERTANLSEVYFVLRDPVFLESIVKGLDDQIATYPDAQKVYPSLTRIYFLWMNGQKKDAIEATVKLLDQAPSDDLRMILVSEYEGNEQYSEAVPLLTSIKPRPGKDEIAVERRLLHDALKAKQVDLAKDTGRKLLLHHPALIDLQMMSQDLNEAGLKDEVADAQTKAQANLSINHSTSSSSPQGDMALVQKLYEARNAGNTDEAESIARRLLERDPLQTLKTNGGDNYIQDAALNMLKQIDRLDPYVEDLEAQLRATPDSLKVKVQLANALLQESDQAERRTEAPNIPTWLRLSRKGNQVEAANSTDGLNWQVVKTQTVDLSDKVMLGMFLQKSTRPISSEAEFDHISWTGNVVTSDAPAPATPTADPGSPSTPTLPPDAATPNAAATNTSTTPAPWSHLDLKMESTDKPGLVTAPKDGVVTLTLPKGDRRLTSEHNGPTNFAYQTMQGDGSLTVHLSRVGAGRSRAGLMLRNSSDPQNGLALAAMENESALEWITDSPSTQTRLSIYSLPLWMKVVRKENQCSAYSSSNGQNWSPIFSRTIPLDTDCYIGLFSGAFGKSSWSNIKINGQTVSDWAQKDLNPGLIPGDVQNTSDHLDLSATNGAERPQKPSATYWAHKLIGDGELIARIDSASGAPAGLFLRADITDEAQSFEFSLHPTQFSLISRVRVNQVARAVSLYDEVIQQDKLAMGLLLPLAAKLTNESQYAASTDIYLRLLKSGNTDALNYYAQIYTAASQCHRLPEVLDALDFYLPGLFRHGSLVARRQGLGQCRKVF